jgi:transcriptional regulator with XRE-family HTH domain
MDEDTRKDGSISVAFGKQFERLREALERGPAELAESSGVGLDVIEQSERGDGGSVNIDTLRKLAGALGLSLSALFEGSTTTASRAGRSVLASWNSVGVAAGVARSSPSRVVSTSTQSSRSSATNSRRDWSNCVNSRAVSASQ